MVPIHAEDAVAIGHTAQSGSRWRTSTGGGHGNPFLYSTGGGGGGSGGGMSSDAPSFVVRSSKAAARAKIKAAAQTSAEAGADTASAVAMEANVKDQIASLNHFEILVTLGFVIGLATVYWPDAPPFYLQLLIIWHWIVSIPLMIHGWIVIVLTFMADITAVSINIYLWNTGRDTRYPEVKIVLLSILLLLTFLRIIITSACTSRCCSRSHHHHLHYRGSPHDAHWVTP